MAQRVRGRGSFVAGSVFLILVGLLHLGAHLQATLAPLPSEAARELRAAMEAFRLDSLGLRSSAADLQNGLSLAFTLLLLFTGTQNLVALRASSDPRRTIVALGRTSAIGTASVAILFAVLKIPPPVITLIPAAACFARASRLARPPT